MLPSACFWGSIGEVPLSVTTRRENRGQGLAVAMLLEGFSERDMATGSM